MAEVALRLLATADFYPGFKEEPGWLACLEDAMRLVNQDAAATGIRRPCQLRVHDDEELNGNGNGNGNGVRRDLGWVLTPGHRAGH